MDLSEIYQLVDFILSKERGSFQTYAELDRIFHLGQTDLYNQYYDEYALTGKIHNALEPFKKKLTFTTGTSPAGFITLPADYMMALPSSHTTPSYGPIRFYNESEWVGAITSQLRPVSTTKPAAKIIAGQIELFPHVATAGVIEYLKKPTPPVYVYSQVGRVITYDAITSTQLQWLDMYIPKVIMKSLSYIGVNLNEADITQYSETKAKETV